MVERPIFKMTLTALVLMFFVIGATILVNVRLARSSPATITVPDDYSTIQAAVNAARPGDTVYVKTATYHQNVVVNKTLSLVGQDTTTTIIDGSGIGDVVNITANSVNVTSFTIRNGQAGRPNAGIGLEYSNNSNIVADVLADNWFGIYFNHCSDCNVVGNNLTTNNGTGIALEDNSESNNVTRNEISGSKGTGIALEGSNYNSIIENNLTNNVEGVVLYDNSYSNTVVGNGITASSDYALSLDDSSRNSLVENTITASTKGIGFIYGSTENNVTGNNVTANDEGIVLDSSSNSNIFLENDFAGNGQQVVSAGSTNVWDDGSRGNYWSDYLTKYSNGSQTDNSGIWNTPYVIDANNADHHPLINQNTLPELPSSYLLLACILACSAVIITFHRKHP